MKKLIKRLKKVKKPIRILVIALLLFILLVPSITFSRFVYKLVLSHIYSSQNFYFNSDFLTEDNPTYTISNWSGADSYTLNIDMNSVMNELKKATEDINYDITYQCTGDVTCLISKESGVIRVANGTQNNDNHDSFSITLTPNHQFSTEEEASIEISASSTSPYKKTLSAKFVLTVETVGLTYEITDKTNDIFAVLRLTNSMSYYTVNEAFDDYEIGDIVEQEVYMTLDEINKNKCSSMMVELSFDPRVIQLDMTNSYFLKAQKLGSYTTSEFYVVNTSFSTYKEGDLINQEQYNSLDENNKTNVSGSYEYIDSFKFNIDAISSADVKFYKRDKTKDYSYPLVNNESIVKVN